MRPSNFNLDLATYLECDVIRVCNVLFKLGESGFRCEIPCIPHRMQTC